MEGYRCYEIDVAEVIASRHTLSIALEAGLWRLVFESDCLKLINLQSYEERNKLKENTSFGNIVL